MQGLFNYYMNTLLYVADAIFPTYVLNSSPGPFSKNLRRGAFCVPL